MILKNSLRSAILISIISVMISCKSGGGGGGSSSDAAPTAETTSTAANNIEYKAFDVTPQAAVGAEITLNLEIEVEDNSVVFYQITDHENVKFKPNSGIIVPNKKKGTLITTLASDYPGTYDFKVTLTNNQNQKSIKSFTTTILN